MIEIIETKVIEHTEQRVLAIPESDFNLPEGWHVVSAKALSVNANDDYPHVLVTVRKTL